MTDSKLTGPQVAILLGVVCTVTSVAVGLTYKKLYQKFNKPTSTHKSGSIFTEFSPE